MMYTALQDVLSALLGAAFEAEGLPAAFGRVVRADRPDLAQFQCNGALVASKQARQNPREIAQRVSVHLHAKSPFTEISLAGPGFINLTLCNDWLSAHVTQLDADARLGAWRQPDPQKIILDYGGPNVAKPLHVGHLRSAIIGESLKRLLRFAGDEVVSDIHLGDWGKQMGQLICQIAQEQPDLIYFNTKEEGPYPTDSPVELADLSRAYPLAAAACREDPQRDEDARRSTAELQAGRPGYRALWKHFVAVSRQSLEQDYADLGISFDVWLGESDADPFTQPLLALLTTHQLLDHSDGAEVVHVTKPTDKKDIPPLIILSKDGTALYGTTDLATILMRCERFAPDRIVYVVDQRQAHHFEQVFRASHLAQLMPVERLEHVGFGTMNGKDGKPFKTREGGVLRLRDLIVMVEEKACARLTDNGIGNALAADALADIARCVGMAALKFADLSNPRATDYIFDLDRFMAFEGKTGPYLQYAVVRIKSLLDKAGFTQKDDSAPLVLSHKSEVDLALALTGFSRATQQAYEKRAPHILCEHAFELAQAFSKFYAACRIADEEEHKLRLSRLTLARLTGRQLEVALELLGIGIPARM